MFAWFKRTWKILSTVVGAIVLISSLAGAMFWAEDRYNNQDHHDADIIRERSFTALKMENLEKAIVMNLEQFRKEQELNLKKTKRLNDYRYYTNILEDINREILKIKQYLRTNPNDSDAKEDYEDLKVKRHDIKQKLRNLMEDGS